MTKAEIIERERFIDTLAKYGVPRHTAELTLRRAKTLQTWAEHECGVPS